MYTTLRNMKDQALIALLKHQAKEIADTNIAGYGNTMLDAANRLETLVMPNAMVADGLTEEEQDFMAMIINWQIENPKVYERIKPFADISISRATLFSVLADYASEREA